MWHIKGLGECRSHYVTRNHERATSADSVCIDRLPCVRETQELPPVGNGETVYMRLPGQSTWSRGMCTGLVGPRSYGVLVGEREFRSNRRHIIRSSEPFRPEISVPETTPPPPPTSPGYTQPDSEPLTVPEELEQPGNTDVEQPVIRRSGRIRKPPVRFGDDVPV